MYWLRFDMFHYTAVMYRPVHSPCLCRKNTIHCTHADYIPDLLCHIQIRTQHLPVDTYDVLHYMFYRLGFLCQTGKQLYQMYMIRCFLDKYSAVVPYKIIGMFLYSRVLRHGMFLPPMYSLHTLYHTIAFACRMSNPGIPCVPVNTSCPLVWCIAPVQWRRQYPPNMLLYSHFLHRDMSGPPMYSLHILWHKTVCSCRMSNPGILYVPVNTSCPLGSYIAHPLLQQLFPQDMLFYNRFLHHDMLLNHPLLHSPFYMLYIL